MLKNFLAVFKHEVIRLCTNRHLRLICLISPFFYCIVLTSVYFNKRITSVPVGIVDMDRTSLSRKTIRYLNSTENLEISSSYISQEQAQEALVKGKIYGYFYIPAGFSSDIKKGKKAIIRVAADYVNIALANPIFLAAADVASEISAIKFSKLPAKPRLSRQRGEDMQNLIQPEVHTIFNKEMNYSDFFLPGLIVIILQQILIVGICFCTAEDRQDNKEQSFYNLAGNNPFIAALGRLAPFVLLFTALSVFFVLAWLRVFDIKMAASIPFILAFIFVFVLCAAAFGLTISVFFKKTVNVFLVLMYFAMAAFFLSGYSWPSYVLPLEVRLIALPVPSTHFMSVLRRAYGADMPHLFSMPDFWVLLILACIYFLLGVLVIKKVYGSPQQKSIISR